MLLNNVVHNHFFTSLQSFNFIAQALDLRFAQLDVFGFKRDVKSEQESDDYMELWKGTFDVAEVAEKRQ